eukprot:jgi/Botrbrau1/1874/Bobra.146_1s0061.1
MRPYALHRIKNLSFLRQKLGLFKSQFTLLQSLKMSESLNSSAEMLRGEVQHLEAAVGRNGGTTHYC